VASVIALFYNINTEIVQVSTRVKEIKGIRAAWILWLAWLILANDVLIDLILAIVENFITRMIKTHFSNGKMRDNIIVMNNSLVRTFGIQTKYVI
jgi:hypothetical protein